MLWKNFLYAICIKGVGSNFIFFHFYKCWVHYRHIKAKWWVKCWSCKSQVTDTKEMSPGIELNDQSLEVVERIFYLSEKSSARMGAVDCA